jgi:hypothetical protein
METRACEAEYVLPLSLHFTHNFFPLYIIFGESGSSVSVVSSYRLDDRANVIRSPAEAKGFLFYPLCPDRLWGPPSVLYNGYRGSFPRG